MTRTGIDSSAGRGPLEYSTPTGVVCSRLTPVPRQRPNAVFNELEPGKQRVARATSRRQQRGEFGSKAKSFVPCHRFAITNYEGRP